MTRDHDPVRIGIARDQYLNYRVIQQAEAARIDHSWLRDSVRCAFERMFTASSYGEAWDNVHILHRYGANRYRYLTQATLLPSYR